MAGFSPSDHATLHAIKRGLTQPHRYADDGRTWRIRDYWGTDTGMAPIPASQRELQVDREEYAIAAMRKCHLGDFHSRLIMCLDEMGEGHCICEVSSNDGTEAVYFDYRKSTVVERDGLSNYLFFFASPWDPQPRETRAWQATT